MLNCINKTINLFNCLTVPVVIQNFDYRGSNNE